VSGQVPSGSPAAFRAFTQTGAPGAPGASLLLYTQSSVLLNLVTGSRTDSLSLEIHLSTRPQLPAATYTATLSLQAQSF
jgi:hypothetical protein